jgi:DnaJ-class molecular chaperone
MPTRTCWQCSGTGEGPRCSECNGKGDVVASDGSIHTCNWCGGGGQERCPQCDGYGTEEYEEDYRHE